TGKRGSSSRLAHVIDRRSLVDAKAGVVFRDEYRSHEPHVPAGTGQFVTGPPSPDDQLVEALPTLVRPTQFQCEIAIRVHAPTLGSCRRRINAGDLDRFSRSGPATAWRARSESERRASNTPASASSRQC